LVKGHQVVSIIIEYADQHDVGAVIIGSRGNGKIKTTIMGSVAHNVFHHTKHPMLIIKINE
jgi:nucleotide-binding universal stress UspA family protein